MDTRGTAGCLQQAVSCIYACPAQPVRGAGRGGGYSGLHQGHGSGSCSATSHGAMPPSLSQLPVCPPQARWSSHLLSQHIMEEEFLDISGTSFQHEDLSTWEIFIQHGFLLFHQQLFADLKKKKKKQVKQFEGYCSCSWIMWYFPQALRCVCQWHKERSCYLYFSS